VVQVWPSCRCGDADPAPGGCHNPVADSDLGRKGLRRMADLADWFRAFVECSLQQAWGLQELVQDGDGDFPFGDGSTTAYVTVEPAPGLGVCVWSYAAYGVKGSLRVLREVNDLNMASDLCKVMWANGCIRVELRVPADQVSAESLGRACGHVNGCTSHIGDLFALVHGGESALAESQAS
jgi:hypothetical protein